MKLDLNFNALTKLRDWWRQVHNNFGIIERECTETRKIADAACTRQELEAYVAEFVGSSEEYMQAIEAFTELYNENQSSVTALEEIFGDRFRYYQNGLGFDVNTAEDNAIYILGAGTLNTPTDNGGILINAPAPTGLKLWFANNGDTYFKNTQQEWTLTTQAVLDAISDLDDEIRAVKTRKCEVVFGTYTGDGVGGATTSRFINLGFTPVAIEIYDDSGEQGNSTTSSTSCSGGLALIGYPCDAGGGNNAIEITDNGFNVKYYDRARTNMNNYKYYFKAYKNGEIMEV